MQKYNYKWQLKNAHFTKDKGKVFSCFAGGGGSTMGYKLAGFDVIGCNEIDPKMAQAYEINHHPKYLYQEPIQTFKLREGLPRELYELDILDGSPPCTSFSVAGNREKDWGKEKKFKEGNAKQVLDTLFFDFIELAKKLQPKIVVAENVKGLLFGNAIKYVRDIYTAFDLAGYCVQHFLLDASKMGVPQRRERVFFVALRKDLVGKFCKQVDLYTVAPSLKLSFNERKIKFGEIRDGKGEPITEHKLQAWLHRKPTDGGIADSKKWAGIKVSGFNHRYLFDDKVMPTITAKADMSLYDTPIKPSNAELLLGGSFPLDYIPCNINIGYIIGMSVPPVMMAQIASCIYDQWLKIINSN